MANRALWIVGIAVTLIQMAMGLFGPSGPIPLGSETLIKVLGDLMPMVTSALAVFFLLGPVRALRSWDQAKVAWASILFGILLCALAEFLWGIMELVLGIDMGEYWPAFTDVLWLVGYAFVALGLILIIVAYLRGGMSAGRPRFYVMINIALLGILAAVMIFIILPMMQDPESTTMEKAFSIAYPALDLTILAPALVLVYITSLFSGFISKPWRVMAIGFVLWTLGDIIYCYLAWIETYSSGHPIDLMWNLSYLLVAAGALMQRRMLMSFHAGGSDA